MLGGDRCRVRLLWLLLLALGMVLMLVLIGRVRGLAVGLPGERHRSSTFFYYMQCSLLCSYIDRSRRPLLWWQVEGGGDW